MLENQKSLSTWSKENEISYHSAWRKFGRGELDGFKDNKGHIYINEAKNEQIPVTSITPTISTVYRTPDLKFGDVSTASTTRKNSAMTNEIPFRFSNLDQGIVPWMDTSAGRNNSSNITTKDTIILCQKSYFNVALVRNIIDLMTEFAVSPVHFKGGNKKSRDFFKAYFRRLGLTQFQDRWYREYFRSGNCFSYIFRKDIKNEDVLNIIRVYNDTSLAAKKVTIPCRFIILNPADITVSGQSNFINPTYNKILNAYEINRLRNPQTDVDKEIYESLPSEVKKQLSSRETSVTIPLSTDNTIAVFYKKQDYEAFGISFLFSVLDSIDMKIAMRKADLQLLRTINQAVLLVTTGVPADQFGNGINQNNLTALTNIFSNESVGRVLISDFSTKATFVQPNLDFLSSDKYKSVDDDISIGLNYVLLSNEKFSNQATKIQVFIERIKHAQQVFIDDFLNVIIEQVSKELNFKSYPEPVFEETNLRDEAEQNRIIVRLIELGILTPSEAFSAFESGKFPMNNEDSITNQEEFRALRDRGLYEPIAGGPNTQKEMLDKTNKQATKTQTTQLEHDDKQGNKQRKHDAENPVAPAPSIHINAPTKSMPAPTGRPSGTKRKKSTNKPRVLGSLENDDSINDLNNNEQNNQTLYSGSKLIDVIKSYDSLEKSINAALKEKYKIKKLSKQQEDIAIEISKIIARNEEPNNWKNKEVLESYVNNPLDKNLDRINEIEDIAASYGLEPHLATLLFNSKKEEIAPEIIEEKIEDNLGGK